VRIRPHRDASGEVAFYSARVPGPHRLTFTGRFQLEAAPSPERGPAPRR
jgi:hypothetical protein